MSASSPSPPAEHVFRVDRFVVPSSAREEFLARVRETHELLRTQPGFVRDLLLERTAAPGEHVFVTLAEWESEAAIENAAMAVQAMRQKTGFDPKEMFARLGIEAEITTYRAVE